MFRVLFIALLAVFVVNDLAPAWAQERVELAQAEKRRTLFDMLFGEEAAPAPPPPPVRQQQRTRKAAPVASAPASQPAPTIEKTQGATRLAVFGDSLAVDLSKALERRYAGDPNLEVINEGVGSSGFVRDDFFDWNRAIGEQVAADSFDLAIVIIGINDRQEIREGGKGYSPLSEGWTAIYKERIAKFLNQLRVAGKPVIWLGLPPMSKSGYSGAIGEISAVQRLASVSGGAEFLDIYERFLGEDGKYSSYGPDVNGQNARMRKSDGIHFSSAGADKLAFYLSQPIRNFYRGGAVTVAVSDSLRGTDAGAMVRLPYQGLGQTRLLEVAGAVIPLGRSAAPAGTLLTSHDLARTEPFPLEQLIEAPMGRVDAFGVGLVPDEDGSTAVP
ncbi:DUF459 domain-containing protein [Devosia rhodophyticola]|uniref:DUF459 domain-containing protein n=1 Tax=Devosia rhodophyticola TaxID=3026423 RepID=A0ABY7YU28_9HYPH|nr:DUF459 domain-containing protein [Devosia rhodophyticola]WDR04850.1 DUF459 domain-containing protein [Devosia rhodophyticola]